MDMVGIEVVVLIVISIGDDFLVVVLDVWIYEFLMLKFFFFVWKILCFRVEIIEVIDNVYISFRKLYRFLN